MTSRVVSIYPFLALILGVRHNLGDALAVSSSSSRRRRSLRISRVLFRRVYSTRQDEATSEGEDEMEGISGLEVVLGGCLVIGPSGRGGTSATCFSLCIFSQSECRAGMNLSYICLPPWMSRCWTGGMPSFSSTFSLICETYSHHAGKSASLLLLRSATPGGATMLELTLYSDSISSSISLPVRVRTLEQSGQLAFSSRGTSTQSGRRGSSLLDQHLVCECLPRTGGERKELFFWGRFDLEIRAGSTLSPDMRARGRGVMFVR